MIFVTVGTQLRFPRLLDMIVDALPPDRIAEVFAQTADPDYRGPLAGQAFLDRDQFEARYAEATLVIGHTGTGTILAARRYRKPLIVVPRRFALGEHRNDHQYATATQLRALGETKVCETTEELAAAIATPPVPSEDRHSPEKERLISGLKGLIDGALARR